MTTCTTTSGAYRCSKNSAHAGPCEAQAPEYAKQTIFVAQHGHWFDVCASCKATTTHDVKGCRACRKVTT